MLCSAEGLIWGKNHRTIGAMIRLECEKEAASLEAQKITAIQTTTGNQ
jgi:hypothetical protein